MSKREQFRQYTIDEIKTFARRQIAERGQSGLSLNAIARELGISGPGMYRYFASRSELLDTLTADALQEFSAALQIASQEPIPASFAEQVRQYTISYRRWASTHFAEYEMVFSKSTLSETVGAERIQPLLAPLLALQPSAARPPESPAIETIPVFSTPFSNAYAGDCWQYWIHLHGLVSLEFNHILPNPASWVEGLYAAHLTNFLERWQ